jgi:hypothetical protein
VTIDDCFIRTDDDCVALKGLTWLLPKDGKPLPVRNVTVRNSVLWVDRARVFLLGHESVAPAMDQITIRDVDVIHHAMTAFLLEPGEHMPLTNVLVENVRLEGAGQPDFITLRPTVNQYMKVQAPGSIRGVTFRNVSVTGDPAGHARVVLRGADAQHAVRNVTFDRVTRYGQPLTANAPHVEVGPNVNDVRFINKPNRAK